MIKGGQDQIGVHFRSLMGVFFADTGIGANPQGPIGPGMVSHRR